MQKLMKAFHKNEKGFTLVELMVVVVIIGILVAIAIPIYGLITQRAELSTMTANLRIIDSAIMMKQADGNTVAVATGTAAVNTELTGYIQTIEQVGTEGYNINATPRATVTIAGGGEGGLAAGTYDLSAILDGTIE